MQQQIKFTSILLSNKKNQSLVKFVVIVKNQDASNFTVNVSEIMNSVRDAIVSSVSIQTNTVLKDTMLYLQ